MYKLHVSANSGNHQVYYRFKRNSYIWVAVLVSVINLMMVTVGRNM